MFNFGSHVEFKQVLKDGYQLGIWLISFELFNFYCEGIIVPNRYSVVIDQDHFSFTFSHFLQVFEILIEASIGFLATVSVKPPFNVIVLVNLVDHSVSIGFITRGVDIHFKNTGNCLQELLQMRSSLDIHFSVVILNKHKNTLTTL